MRVTEYGKEAWSINYEPMGESGNHSKKQVGLLSSYEQVTKLIHNEHAWPKTSHGNFPLGRFLLQQQVNGAHKFSPQRSLRGALICEVSLLPDHTSSIESTSMKLRPTWLTNAGL